MDDGLRANEGASMDDGEALREDEGALMVVVGVLEEAEETGRTEETEEEVTAAGDVAGEDDNWGAAAAVVGEPEVLGSLELAESVEPAGEEEIGRADVVAEEAVLAPAVALWVAD